MNLKKWRNDAHFMEALYVVFLALCLVLLASCAHDSKLDKKIADETSSLPAMSATDRAKAAEKTIESAPLSEEQKQKLESLALSANTDLQSLRDENSRLRLLLVQQLVNPKADDREIDAIKKRILETDKLSNKRWLAALDDARQVLGRKNEQDRRFYRAFMYEEPAEDTAEPRRQESELKK